MFTVADERTLSGGERDRSNDDEGHKGGAAVELDNFFHGVKPDDDV